MKFSIGFTLIGCVLAVCIISARAIPVAASVQEIPSHAFGGKGVSLAKSSGDTVLTGDMVTLTATLSDGAAEVPVQFFKGGASYGDPVETNSSGIATVIFVPEEYGTFEFYATASGYDDSSTVQIKVVKIAIRVKRYSDSEWSTSGVTIAAGGLNSNVHKAQVEVEVQPSLSGSNQVQVFLIGGGGGHNPSSWFWSDSYFKKAKIDFNNSTFEHGGSGAISMTAGGTLPGVVWSSNKLESTTVKVDIPSLSLYRTCDVQFALGEFTVNLGDSPFPLNEWRSFQASSMLGEAAVSGHDLKFVVSRVVLASGQVYQAGVGENQNSATSLVNYVQLDEGAYATYKYDTGTTDSSGNASSEFRVVDSNVVSFDITVFDFNVAK